MLRLMRENAGSWIVKVLLGIIVIVFVLWGVGSNDSNKYQDVATVNGEPVSADEYQQSYQNLVAQMRQRFGNNLNDEMIEMLQIETQALNRLIDKKLLLQESGKLKIRISDEELAESIKNTPMFQNEGAFNANIYKTLLRSNGLSPDVFETMQREGMTIEKLRSMVIDNVKISDSEISEWYNWQNAAVDINYVMFSPDDKKDISPSDAEIETYYKENGDKYKTEPKAKASYIRLNPEDYMVKVDIPPDDIKNYYEEYIQEFESPKTVAARHILIKVPVESGEKVEEEKKAAILDILKEAKAGKDFAELAKKYSEGPSKENGGYLNAFKYEDMVKPFSDQAFSMKPGEISDPVRTQFGWHIIKVEKVNEAAKKSLEEATPGITDKLKTQKARTLAYNDAETIYEAIVNGDDLSLAAETASQKVETTDFFSEKDPIKGIPNSFKFAQATFSLPVMETSDVEEFEDGYYIIRLDEKIEPRVPDLKDVIESVRVDLVAKMQNDAALNTANEFLNTVKKGVAFADEAQKIGLAIKSTGLFKRQEAIPEIGYEREISQEAFTLKTPDQVNEAVLKGKKGYYVISLKERKLPDPENLAKEREEIKTNLLQKKESGLFEDWLAQLRSESEITIKEGFLDK
ncbi:MAG: SurA N-terminal domain-containing protein [Proteobacteria bacterium]|nr:SurA N-terminal domain-containing protein [Pseudomonadota bacterium]